MKCWVCSRQARGLGHTDNRHGLGDPRRYPIDWVFCSQRCQAAFHALYGCWASAAQPGEVQPVINATEVEHAAMGQCVRFFGEAAAEIGFDKPLGSYSEDEAMRVVEAIVTAYSEAMTLHHEQSRIPAVRGLGVPPRDPIKAAPRQRPSTGFDDMPSDAPWEDGHD